MSDSPEGPNWWRATDGRWYPPELFTGPPELRPGAATADTADDTAARTSPEASPEPRPAPGPEVAEVGAGRSRSLLLVIAAVVVVVALAGAWVLFGSGDDSTEAEPTASPGSTSEGPVRVAGAIALSSSVPAGTTTPKSCDEWATVIRVQIQDPAGASLSEFFPTVASGGEADRADDGTESVECSFDYRADVPGDPSYSVALIDVRGGGRMMLVETVDGAEKGAVDGPAMQLTYSCSGSGGGTACNFSRS